MTALHGNVSNLLPQLHLRPGLFIIVFHNGRVLLGEGVFQILLIAPPGSQFS